MNVEKLKRVNALAQTLRQQGIVANSEDAVGMAAKISGSETEEEFSQVKVDADQNIVIRDHDSGEVLSEEPTQTKLTQEQDTFSREEVVQVLQSFADQFIKEVDKLSKRVSEQSKTIALLQSKINDFDTIKTELPTLEPVQQEASVVEPTPEPVQQTLGVEEPKQELDEPAKQSIPTESESSHPRSGGYTDNDVSIEKIFYCGQT